MVPVLLSSVPVSGVIKTLDGTSMDWNIQNEVHQKYIRYILNAGGWEGNFLFRLTKSPFFNRQGEQGGNSRLLPNRFLDRNRGRAIICLGA